MGTKRQGDETARGRNDRGRNGKGTKRPVTAHNNCYSMSSVAQLVSMTFPLMSKIPAVSKQVKHLTNLCYHQSSSGMSELHEDSQPKFDDT